MRIPGDAGPAGRESLSPRGYHLHVFYPILSEQRRLICDGQFSMSRVRMGRRRKKNGVDAESGEGCTVRSEVAE